MAKGDGKQRRPKQRPAPPPPPSPPPSPPQPSRINQENSLLNARRQIALVRAYKQRAAAGPPRPTVRTSFRKKRDPNAVNRTSGNGPEVELDLDVGVPPQLLVDGYNVIGAWPRLKKRFERGELAEAREMLLEDVASLAAGRYDVVVVFDASGSADRVEGKDRIDEYAGGLVRVAYAHDSADAYIEREARRMRGEKLQVQVATSDMAIGTAVTLHGASVTSSQRFVAQLKASRNTAAAVLDDFNKRQSRLAGRGTSAVWDAIDPRLRKSLEEEWAAQSRARNSAAQARLPKRADGPDRRPREQ